MSRGQAEACSGLLDLGERAAGRRGASGGTTIETPGAQQALDRTQTVEVALDRARSRHLIDFAVLTTLIRPSDAVQEAGRRDREHLGAMLAALAADRRTWAGVEGAYDGIARLRLALAPAPGARPADAEPFTRRRRD